RRDREALVDRPGCRLRVGVDGVVQCDRRIPPVDLPLLGREEEQGGRGRRGDTDLEAAVDVRDVRDQTGGVAWNVDGRTRRAAVRTEEARRSRLVVRRPPRAAAEPG